MKKVYILLILMISLCSINVYADNKCSSTTGCKNCPNSAAESSCKSTQEYKNWEKNQSNNQNSQTTEPTCNGDDGCKHCKVSAALTSCMNSEPYRQFKANCEQKCKGIGSASAQEDCIAKCTPQLDSSGVTSPTNSNGPTGPSAPTDSNGKTTEKINTVKKDTTKANCDTLFGTNTETGKILHDIYNIIKVIVPIILLAMSIKDFGAGMLSQNDKALRDALIRFSKRLVIAILILVLPTILNFVLKLLEIDTCFL